MGKMSLKVFRKRVAFESLKVNSVRLDLFLREELPEFLKLSQSEVSNSKIRRLILAGCVQVNGRQIRIPGFNVLKGSLISAQIDEKKFFFEKQPDDIKFELTDSDVLFEDEFIILVNKPAFFPTEATIAGNRDNLHDCIVRYLWKKNPELRNPPYAGIMHRLDRETSGVILFTKQRCVNAKVHEMFDSSKPENKAQKVYAVVCCSGKKPVPDGTSFCVEMFMGRISGKSQAGKWGLLPESRGGVFSHTDFTVLGSKIDGKSGKQVVFVRAMPLTGRTHQIRVHLASRGLPVLGDSLYGKKDCSRLMLHAESLTFLHPVSGKQMTVKAPLPDGFAF